MVVSQGALVSSFSGLEENLSQVREAEGDGTRDFLCKVLDLSVGLSVWHQVLGDRHMAWRAEGVTVEE